MKGETLHREYISERRYQKPVIKLNLYPETRNDYMRTERDKSTGTSLLSMNYETSTYTVHGPDPGPGGGGGVPQESH